MPSVAIFARRPPWAAAGAAGLPGGPIVACALVAAFCGAAGAESPAVVRTGAVRLEPQVASLRDRRDAGVVRQRYDYSCGSASLATLLTYGLDDPVGEDDLLRALLESRPADEIAALQERGLSLAGLQQLAEGRGHRAQGFRIDRSQLGRISRPVIVFIRPGGYEHFAVLKGVRGDRVHLADPSLGNVRMPLYRFVDMWADASGRGVVFAVEPASGRWPQAYALELGPAGGPLQQATSAERRAASGTPFPPALPQR